MSNPAVRDVALFLDYLLVSPNKYSGWVLIQGCLPGSAHAPTLNDLRAYVLQEIAAAEQERKTDPKCNRFCKEEQETALGWLWSPPAQQAGFLEVVWEQVSCTLQASAFELSRRSSKEGDNVQGRVVQIWLRASNAWWESSPMGAEVLMYRFTPDSMTPKAESARGYLPIRPLEKATGRFSNFVNLGAWGGRDEDHPNPMVSKIMGREVHGTWLSFPKWLVWE
jgi:hypothetical protein